VKVLQANIKRTNRKGQFSYSGSLFNSFQGILRKSGLKWIKSAHQWPKTGSQLNNSAYQLINAGQQSIYAASQLIYAGHQLIYVASQLIYTGHQLIYAASQLIYAGHHCIYAGYHWNFSISLINIINRERGFICFLNPSRLLFPTNLKFIY
jgi:hypothetical protein